MTEQDPRRVLIVDGQNGETSPLAHALRVEGLNVLCACDAAEVFERLASEDVHVALVDVMMPGVNGLDLARQLRRLHPAIKVVLTSAYHLSERQLVRADCGAVGFVPKPYEVNELVAFLCEKARG